MGRELIIFSSLFAPTREEKPCLSLSLAPTCSLNRTQQIGVSRRLGPRSIDHVRVDPWKVKKKLTPSDLGNSSRLLLPKNLIRKHVLPILNHEVAQELNSDLGALVTVYDSDQNAEHVLVFKYWGKSQKSYILQTKWRSEFVNRKELKEGDEIGLYWDAPNSIFVFSLLSRAADR